jgi:uncharacterized protein
VRHVRQKIQEPGWACHIQAKTFFRHRYSRTPQGFAVIDPDIQRQFASMGGKASHASGKAHRFTSTEAQVAGRLGGLARRNNHEDQKSQ